MGKISLKNVTKINLSSIYEEKAFLSEIFQKWLTGRMEASLMKKINNIGVKYHRRIDKEISKYGESVLNTIKNRLTEDNNVEINLNIVRKDIEAHMNNLVRQSIEKEIIKPMMQYAQELEGRRDSKNI